MTDEIPFKFLSEIHLRLFLSCQILHMHIASVEKLPLSTTGSPLLIRCKTFLSVTFVIAKERDSHDVYSTLIKLCQPGAIRAFIKNLYASLTTCFHSKHPKPLLFSIHVEQRRFGQVGWVGFLQVGKRVPAHEGPQQRVAVDVDEQRLRSV